uniref:Galactose oxidase n=1 Tax=Chloropicon primus TaxID=1764295 RepID=A0A7S2T422_9CHLO|mmetsp:Transcript_6126/g.18296  ORF Transcript_6126/g.18296 Transcript_6126/m.18296 type:complete len:102 (+) Transcript_6126:3-308(+)
MYTVPARYNHAAVADAKTGTVYIFGGVTENYSELQDLWSYEVANNRWRKLNYANDLPSVSTKGGLFDQGGIQVGQKMLTFGGQSYGQTLQTTLAMQLYNIR